jgi:DmsE family decaheme c-type cytochrome
MGQLNRCARDALRVAGIALGLAFPLVGQAADPDPGSVTVLASVPEGYADAAADDCLDCHDETSRWPVLSILATPHAVKGDRRTPLASTYECQACHGKSQAHMESDSLLPPPPEIVFGVDAPPGPQNEKCLSCHQGAMRMNWFGSVHERQNVACASCHTTHAIEDPVLMKNINPMVFMRKGQASVCFQCHKEKRAQIQHRVSSHPLREGKVDCSDCHNPHGSIGPTNVSRPTLNETCYQCHAEKRGPFLWEHAPAREDCGNCHTPHGSNHPVLLKSRVPQLCQGCHLASFHPSTAYTGPRPLAGAADFHLVEKGCLNCHSEVHGSNHPSGVRWTR